MKNSKTLLGFVAGAAIGAVAAILFAPDSGKETRRKIFRKSDSVKDAVEDAADAVENGADVIRDKIDSKFQEWKGNYKSELS